jgi:hypothetical protein
MPAPAPMPTPNTHNYYGPVHIGDNTYNGKAINVKDKASELKLCQGIWYDGLGWTIKQQWWLYVKEN